MSLIAPFRAVTYHPRLAGSLDHLIAPPYDVISPSEQEALYARHPCNCVRIILNRVEPGDDPATAPYQRAAAFLRDWLAEGILAEDHAPAYYLYRQDFTDPVSGERKTRRALFCALRLHPYSEGVVLPHEETRTSAREDRLRLLRATAANTEPIYGLFDDDSGRFGSLTATVEQGPPDMRANWQGDLHALWRVSNSTLVAGFEQAVGSGPIWIADGHHRYETSLAFRDELAAAHPEAAAEAGRILIGLTPFDDPGLVVLPTHRLVRNLPPERIAALAENLEGGFHVEHVDYAVLAARAAATEEDGRIALGLALPERALWLTLADAGLMEAFAAGRSPAWRALDVSVLHTLILERLLGISADQLATTQDIVYTRDREEALRSVQTGACQAAFILRRPSARQVRLVALAREKMPPKSTYFYPKLWSGLVMRRLLR